MKCDILNVMIILLLTVLISACGYFPRSTPIPMTSIADADNKQHDTLMIFLPGMGDGADDFVRQGYFEAVRKAQLPVDMIAVNAFFSYYQKGNFKERFYQDILVPAIANGYKKIWLVGISMGGYGSLFAAKEYGDMIAGVIAIAPWLGSEEMIAELSAQGGIKQWNGVVANDVVEDYEKNLWLWLKEYSNQSSVRPSLYLLYGQQDRLRLGHKLLEKMLADERVLIIEGRHRWVAWKELWGRLLDDVEFRQVLLK